jgi:molecular chaperone DnaK
MQYHKVIGIDFGTTYSRVSLWDDVREESILIPNPVDGRLLIPSVVGLTPEGKVIVGTQAQRNLVLDPANTVIEIKRLMGSYQRAPNPAIGDTGKPTTVRFRERDYLPQEIAAFIMIELKRMAEQFVGESIYDAVISCPAYFTEPQRGAIADAAAMARLNLRMLINEPTAAAFYFGMDRIDDGNRHVFVVYDLGGGTFDVSIVTVSGNSIDVIGTGGDPRLGGSNFDDRITAYALQQIQAKYGVDLSSDPSIMARMKIEAEVGKRNLVDSAATMLNLPFLTPEISANIPLQRDLFERLTQDLLQKTIDCLDQVIESAHMRSGITGNEIEQVLLVGGGTRMPGVRRLLADHLRMDIADVRADMDMEGIVSRGAALAARNYQPSKSYEGEGIKIEMPEETAWAAPELKAKLMLCDVTSHTLGILVNRREFLPLIPKESQIPVANTQDLFTKGEPYQEIPLIIIQGEDAVTFNLVGEIRICLPEHHARSDYHLRVTMQLDTKGLLSVRVLCLNNNQVWETNVLLDTPMRMSQNEIEKKAQHLLDLFADDSTEFLSAPSPPISNIPRPPFIQQPLDPDSMGLPSPPPNVPERYAGLIRRTRKLAKQLLPGDPALQQLARTYAALIKALDDNSSDIEDLSDDLYDIYFQIRDNEGSQFVPRGTVDGVHFSVTSPVMVPGESYIVSIWAHLGNQREKVIAMAREECSTEEIRIASEGPIEISRGTVLTVRMRISDLVVDPPEKTIQWRGEIGKAGFFVYVPDTVGFGKKLGTAVILIDGIPIMKVSFLADIARNFRSASPLSAKERRYNTAFASYATEDRDAVLARIQGMQKAAPNLDIFLDVAKLRSGENWRDRLRQEILARDVMYLFWSEAASHSKWVDWEWRCGLQERGIEFIDPCPLAPPNLISPPFELADKLHFNDWVLAYMSLDAARKSDQPQTRNESGE